MVVIKLTATYANEEGRLSKTQVTRFLDDPSIVELDFVQDVLTEVADLYEKMRAKVFPNATVYELEMHHASTPDQTVKHIVTHDENGGLRFEPVND